MTVTARSISRKPAQGTKFKRSKNSKRAAGPKEKTLAQMNRWMEENAERVMKAARENTLRLTGKEVL